MNTEQIDRVFGRGRLKMATGEHVEVFREAAGSGQRRRYTKRFLNTRDGDYGHWTEREWRILARLIGHGIGCVPEVVQFDRGAPGGTQIVQTYDAGATVDQWATILPVVRSERVHRHVFEDCAHWWALAHHCLAALRAIHALHLVHLDIKGDNVCIPVGPVNFDPDVPRARLYPAFAQLALIDFAFSLVSREPLANPLPIGWQTTYDYQSPRLLHALEAGRSGDLQPTRELDWRCDMYSLAAMLKRYLPDDYRLREAEHNAGWSGDRYHAAKRLLLALRDAHDRDIASGHPHDELLGLTESALESADLRASLDAGWTLARDAEVGALTALPITPLTRLAPSIRATHTTLASRLPPPAPSIETMPEPIAALPSPVIENHSPLASLPPVTVSPRYSVPGPRVVRRRLRAEPVGAGNASDHWKEKDVRQSRGRSRTDKRRSSRWIAPTLSLVMAAGVVIATAPQLNEMTSLAAMANASVDAFDAFLSRIAMNAGDAARVVREQHANTAPPEEIAQVREQAAPKETAQVREQAAPREIAQVPEHAASNATAPFPEQARQPSEQRRSVDDETRQHVESRRATLPVVVAPAPARPAASTPMLAPDLPNAKHASPKDRPTSQPSLRESPTRASTAKLSSTQKNNRTETRLASAPSKREIPSRPVHAQEIASKVANQSSAWAIANADAKPVAAGNALSSTSTFVMPPAAPSTSQVASAGSPPVSATSTVVPPSSPTAFIETPASRPSDERRTQTPRTEGLLSSLLNLAKRGGKPAPIEERTAADRAIASLGSKAAARAVSRPAAEVAAAPTQTPAPSATSEYRTVPAPAVAADVVTRPLAASTPGFENAKASSPVDAPVSPLTSQEAPTDAYEQPPQRTNENLSAQGARFVSEVAPRTAARAELEIARVLAQAAASYRVEEQPRIVDAARRTWQRNAISSVSARAARATPLKDAARRAFYTQRNIGNALDLHLQAFGSDPYDPEIAGNLAALYLRLQPSQPYPARHLAMHAMALTSAQTRAPRAQDWTTFATASALIGRADDATHGLFVAAALSRDVGSTCKTALAAVTTYGDRMRVPVESMLLRLHEQGRDHDAPYCTFPPRVNYAGRFF